LIAKLEEGIFYSELTFIRDNEAIKIDSRTSDAVALALRFKCPIYTTTEILDKAGIFLEDKEEEVKYADDEIPFEGETLESKSFLELEAELDMAIENEDYEAASKIRDEMKRRTDTEK
jgi:bifunctional DNase/RNase